MKERAYKVYLLVVLALVGAFNYKDRVAFGLVLQDIKVELALSDTQLGLLSGIAFALFYTAMGIPLARWADRGNRVTVIATSTALWSAAVALCALAGNFVQLLLIRIGVAVGEAGSLPAANSLIADHFSRAERPRANAIFALAGPLSFVLGYFVAGWLNQFYGWRVMFMLLGLPGVGLAALVWFTLREPRQGSPAARPAGNALVAGTQPVGAPSSLPSIKTVCVILWSNPTFRHLLFAFAVANFFGIGIQQWKPTFFVRSFGLKTGELGTWLAAITGIGGFFGLYLGGELASRFAPGNERLQLKAMAIAYTGFGCISVGIYLSPNHYVAFALMAVGIVGVSMISGPLFAILQTLVPSRMRAMSIAFLYLFTNLIGLGLGPLVAGALSDLFRPWAGEESLRYALLALCPGYVWAAWHLWRASRTVSRDLEVAEARHPLAAQGLG